MGDINKSKWNFFKSLQEVSFNGQVSITFKERLVGLARVVMGNIGKSKFNEHRINLYGTNYHEDTTDNHYGLYDLFTLTLLYRLEHWCSGRFLDFEHGRVTFLATGLVFGWTYVAAALILTRAAVGLIAAAALFIPVGFYELYKINFNSKRKSESISVEPQANNLYEEVDLTKERNFKKEKLLSEHAHKNLNKLVQILARIGTLEIDGDMKQKACKYYDKALAAFSLLNDPLQGEYLDYLQEKKDIIDGFRVQENNQKPLDDKADDASIDKDSYISKRAFRNYMKLNEGLCKLNNSNNKVNTDIEKQKACKYYDKALASFTLLKSNPDQSSLYLHSEMSTLKSAKQRIEGFRVKENDKSKKSGGFFKILKRSK